MPISLRSRLLAWAMPGALVVAGGALVFAWLAAGYVSRQEDALWQSRVARAVDLLRERERSLELTIKEYALWDEMVDFVRGLQSEAWEEVNLGPWLVEHFEVNFVIVLDASDRLVYQYGEIGALTAREASSYSELVELARERPGTSVLAELNGEPAWLVAGTIHPSLEEEFEGPSHGTLVLGHTLSRDYLARLSQAAGVTFRIERYSGADEVPATGARRARAWMFAAPTGAPVAEVVLEEPPSLAAASIRAIWGLAGYLLAAIVLGLGLSVLAVERTLVTPLMALRTAISGLREGEGVPERLLAGREDELGQVAHEFNTLAAELASSELRLTRSEDRRLALLGGIPDHILLVDDRGIVQEEKPPETRELASPEESAIGRPLAEILPAPAARTIRELIAGGEEGPIATIEFASGAGAEERHFEARVATSEAGDGVVILRDVTERRRAEADRARLTAVLDATPDFVATADLDGKARYINPAGRRMLGIDPGDSIANVKLQDLAGASHRGTIESEVLPFAMREGEWSGESIIAGSNGQEVPVSQVVLAHDPLHGGPSFLSTIARDISERKRFEQRLLHIADHDPLTDLYGRKRFREELARELARAVRHQVPGAVLFIDLDEFKYLNDSLGHQAGDEFLVSLAGVLRRIVRDSDVAARLGGDEFAVLIGHATEEGALTMGNSLLEAIREHHVVLNGTPVGLTPSIGIALFPEHGSNVEELLAAADLAMYQSKRNGRNQVTCYEPDSAVAAELEMKVEGEGRIRSALAQDRFRLFAQPIYCISSGRVAMYELLVRLIEPSGEVVLPAAFLDAAERFGLIRSIDRWVVTKTIETIASFSKEDESVPLAVNLSRKTLSDSEFPSVVRSALERHGVDAGRMLFEVSERAAVADMEQAQTFVSELRELGCRFALDDFGVGFSSLYHLKHLEVDHIKMDGSFIRDLPRNPVDQHLVKAIVEVARALGKKSMAEFVGDAETLELLKTFGVDFAQGYALGRPEPRLVAMARRESIDEALKSSPASERVTATG